MLAHAPPTMPHPPCPPPTMPPTMPPTIPPRVPHPPSRSPRCHQGYPPILSACLRNQCVPPSMCCYLRFKPMTAIRGGRRTQQANSEQVGGGGGGGRPPVITQSKPTEGRGLEHQSGGRARYFGKSPPVLMPKSETFCPNRAKPGVTTGGNISEQQLSAKNIS